MSAVPSQTLCRVIGLQMRGNTYAPSAIIPQPDHISTRMSHHQLFVRIPATSLLPSAHLFPNRTSEIFKKHVNRLINPHPRFGHLGVGKRSILSRISHPRSISCISLPDHIHFIQHDTNIQKTKTKLCHNHFQTSPQRDSPESGTYDKFIFLDGVCSGYLP